MNANTENGPHEGLQHAVKNPDFIKETIYHKKITTRLLNQLRF